MQLKIQECSGCSKTLPIVNRKYMLCNVCNRKRLQGEESGLKRPLKRTPLKSRKRVNSVSIKQKEKNKSIKATYDLMSKIREHVCTGCGTTKNLSHSHIIPRSRRSDLVDNIENITYHCLVKDGSRGCHDVWEHGTLEERKTLNDYTALMKYIKKVDPQWYFLLHK